jgi:antitoxin component YwqK of YwqJK toxin-antitoxin module
MFNRKWLVLTALIIGGCVGIFIANRPDVEEPVSLREMTRDQLELREEELFVKGESEAYDGALVAFFPENVCKLKVEIRDGKSHGISRGWYENGQQEVEEYFSQGVSQGKRTRWFNNGSIKSEAIIVDGKISGTFRKWHDNGNKAAEAQFVEGTAHGISQGWDRDGKLKSRVVLKEGEIVERQYFTVK